MLDANGVSTNEFLEYKGRPLVRKDDDLYYGDLSQYYVKMMILTEKPSKLPNENIPDNIAVQLFAPGKPFPEKQISAKGLTDAFETAAAWLDRYNK